MFSSLTWDEKNCPKLVTNFFNTFLIPLSSNFILFFNFQDLEKAVVVNIHGSEYVHLSQTCQSLFGPLSHNLLVPEVAVGECIRLLLPVSNPFQTPLLMRKLRLIWKFTDAADSENSYFSNTDLEKAVECVKVEPIER